MNFNTEWIILFLHIFILLFIDFFDLHKKQEVIKSKKLALETLFFKYN
jgi:tellurite resistance protein TerC